MFAKCKKRDKKKEKQREGEKEKKKRASMRDSVHPRRMSHRERDTSGGMKYWTREPDRIGDMEKKAS